MKIKVLIIVAIILVGCANNQKKNDVANANYDEESEVIDSQDATLEVYNFNGLEKFLNKKDDKTYIINFWATWCKPCIKELPHFEKINAKYAKQNVEVILVSLDFPHLYEKKLKPFIVEKKLRSKVIALDDVDMNTWIPKVDETWSGAIPATIIYRNDTRKFFEGSFTYEALEAEVKQFLN